MRFTKQISAMMAVCLLAAGTVSPAAFAEADSALLYGDADQSGNVDVSDAVLLARYYAEDWRAELTDAGRSYADVNLDGEADIDDVVMILRYITKQCDRLGVAETLVESAYNAVNLMEGVETAAPQGKAADEAFISSQLALTANLLQETAKLNADGKNLMISPLSVSQALAMTANGAAGTTKNEMASVLGGEIDLDTLNEYYYSYTANLGNEKKAALHTANSIWFRDDEYMIQVPEAFLQKNADYYGAGAFRAAFDQSTVDDINNWVKFHTHEMIPSVIHELSNDAVMVLVNALAFEAEWAEPYNDHEVGESDFTLSDGSKITVPMMYSDEYCYLSDENATGFIKPYAGGAYSFAAILPNESVTVSDYVGSMNAESLQKLLDSRSSETVITAMPKFEFAYSESLVEPLTDMGMPTAFTPFSADFTGLNTAPEAYTFISDVLHKTFIKVDERGTKAGAVTAVIMKNATAVMDPPKQVILNRPFLFMILDEHTQLPVFIGYVTDPTQK